MADIRMHPNGGAVVRFSPSEAKHLPKSEGTKKAKVISTEKGVLIAPRNQTSKQNKVMRAYQMNARRYDKVMRDLAK